MVETDTLLHTKTVKKTHLRHGTYLCSLYKGLPPTPPPGAKNTLQITSLAAYASETKMASLRDERDLGLHQLTKRDSGIFSMYTLQKFDGLTVIFKGELAPRRLQNSRFDYHKIGFSRHARVPPSPLSYSPFYPCSRPFFRLLA